MKLSIKAGMFYEVHDIHAVPSTDKPARKQVIQIIGARRDPASSQMTTVALIRCDTVSTPWPTPFEWFEERVSRGEFIQIDEAHNPAAPGIRCVEDLKDKKREANFKRAVAENSTLIAPVLALGWDAFNLHERNKVLRQIAAGSVDAQRHSVRWLNELLWRHWTGGAMALGPQYYRCGALSRAELAEQMRRGKEMKAGRRPGRTATLVTTEMASRPNDRGGCYIDPFAAGFISTLISEYFNDELRKKEIELCLERRRKTLPWSAVQGYVNGKLSERPDYKHITASVGQIRYIGLKNVSVLAVMNKVMGKRYMELNHRETFGDYRDVAFYAGHRYEIDGVRADIHLVDNITHMPIGRPNIVLVADTYSGLITGVYITVEELNFTHVSRALHCAFSPKPDWCQSTVELQIGAQAWPSDGRCDHLTADNAQFLTDAAQLIPELVADTGICRAYRPDGKGLIESLAELANLGTVHLHRYGVTKGPKERAKDDPAKEATVTVLTFAREFIRWVVDVANHRALPVDRELDLEFIATGLERTPFNVWNWSQRIHGGPPHVYKKETWMPRLLERVDATVTERGLEVEGVYFDLPEDEAFKLMKATASVGKVTYRPAHIDRLTTQQIYLVPDDIAQPPQVIPRSRYSRNCIGRTFGEATLLFNSQKAQAKSAKQSQSPRKHEQTKAQAEATTADKDNLIAEHGSLGARNVKAKGMDLERVKAGQAKRDNDKITLEMHGSAPPPDKPADGITPNTPSSSRPGCLSS